MKRTAMSLRFLEEKKWRGHFLTVGELIS
jgi:hypothetical protein